MYSKSKRLDSLFAAILRHSVVLLLLSKEKDKKR